MQTDLAKQPLRLYNVSYGGIVTIVCAVRDSRNEMVEYSPVVDEQIRRGYTNALVIEPSVKKPSGSSARSDKRRRVSSAANYSPAILTAVLTPMMAVTVAALALLCWMSRRIKKSERKMLIEQSMVLGRTLSTPNEYQLHLARAHTRHEATAAGDTTLRPSVARAVL